MNRPKIFVVPPEHVDRAWPSISSLGILPREPATAETRAALLDAVRDSVASGREELHVVVNGAGETVACFTVFENHKDHGMIVRFIAGNDAPIWLGYIMRNIFELAASRGFSYAKVASESI
ncbi:MAG: hypothetical protein B7Z37_23480 [Verrucomicrobia bacterium 12-59-8]|nr:MAG: hypothetical protein B7Z37_23480 [Verrucomicrobia bacterium 12-59-8]